MGEGLKIRNFQQKHIEIHSSGGNWTKLNLTPYLATYLKLQVKGIAMAL